MKSVYLSNVRHVDRKNEYLEVHAEARDLRTGMLEISATLDYILDAAEDRGWVIVRNPLETEGR